MYRTAFAIALLALAAVGWQQHQVRPYLQFKEERMFIEYSPALNEAALLVEAETEAGVEGLEIRDPLGSSRFKLWAASGQQLSLSGFMVESLESSPEELFAAYPEGIYDLRARSTDGDAVWGSAVLSHELPAQPIVLHPRDGDVNVPATNLIVAWHPDAAASGYKVILEQGENDGLTADVPAGQSSFQVPNGILAAGTQTHLEIGAIGPNGNRTLAEISFTTR